MIPVWRLTRNRHTRRVYEVLGAVGVTGTRMLEFEADTGDTEPLEQGTDPEVAVDAVPTTDDALTRLDLDFSIPVSFLDREWVVVATADGAAVGRALVSVDQQPYVEPLRERMTFDGAYVRKVYVGREWRNRGIAKRLVGRSLTVAREELGADTAHALIAADNKPSQWVFEANGFRPVRRYDYLRLFGLERRGATDLP
jgi:GNAT superfamily N-acetyltransferase